MFRNNFLCTSLSKQLVPSFFQHSYKRLFQIIINFQKESTRFLKWTPLIEIFKELSEKVMKIDTVLMEPKLPTI